MKNKIKLVVLIAFAGLLTFGVESCKKYPEGPTISLRTRKERVANTWKVDNYKVYGTDLTSLFADYTETYTKDGNYSYNGNFLMELVLGLFKIRMKKLNLLVPAVLNHLIPLLFRNLKKKYFGIIIWMAMTR